MKTESVRAVGLFSTERRIHTMASRLPMTKRKESNNSGEGRTEWWEVVMDRIHQNHHDDDDDDDDDGSLPCVGDHSLLVLVLALCVCRAHFFCET
jgi:hypothetical protein